ncbi:hypothetical protein IE077_002149 [Cardiosporidium cionae]|uniref:Uncharacterized protein n=1 Tax=Cardiosporidium cionae TaxID=476202 RepID=A0ABQ7JBG4_9APIC|nr:hypothetical protein IE077_002149 [Cardiosporidium cionae]|eukprot:KAF8821332.1 hypothetical protein IE077_002149 [Cardiosporidium cionae]
MNGCSKQKTHRLLNPVLDLYQRFPKMEYWQGHSIAQTIRKRDQGDVFVRHPCVKSWNGFIRCIRRFPNSTTTRCKVEALTHKQCLETNKDWIPGDYVQYVKILETFKVFNETASFKYKKPNYRKEAAGTIGTTSVWRFLSLGNNIYKNSQSNYALMYGSSKHRLKAN